MASVSTRLSNEIFLIGLRAVDPLTTLKQLATTRQVLQRFHYQLKESKLVRSASHLTIQELMELWQKSAIPTKQKKHIIEKLENIHSHWLLLKKNKGRCSTAQQQRVDKFLEELDSLFDISHEDAMGIIRIKEDSDFLQDQRTNRKMYMGTEDKDLQKKQERSLQRQKEEEERRIRASLASAAVCSSSDICLISEKENSGTSDFESDDEFIPTQLKMKSQLSKLEEHKNTVSKKQLFTPHVTSALDRNKISDREAVRVIVPLAAALGHDPSCLPVSRSTIQRTRKKARKAYAESVKGKFRPDFPLVVHWDGKLLPEIFGFGKVERLPVFVSGDGHNKLLGVPKLTVGTGENAANAIHNLLEEWNVTELVQAVCFDTTSVNTGCFNGACVLLEEKLERELLWLACRHHTMELVLAKTFTLCFGSSSSPDIPIFKRFKAVWNSVVRDNYRGLELKAETKVFADQAITFLKHYMKTAESYIRDDYKELIELTLIVLGCPPAKIHWRAPGPIHHARWMAKLQYALKIFLFRDQRDVFNLTEREERQILRFVQFGALLYTKVWTEAPLATEAPETDFKFLKDLENYLSIDKEIALSARKVMERHMWYLSDDLVGLSLFSDRVPMEEKQRIVERMTALQALKKRNVRGEPQIFKEDGVRLSDFATRRTAELLSRMNIGKSFLSLPPEKWNHNDDYCKGKERLQNLQVVNDSAERGVKLIEDFNKLITNDEDEKQFLLQVVEANRKCIPSETTKKSVLDSIL